MGAHERSWVLGIKSGTFGDVVECRAWISLMGNWRPPEIKFRAKA